MYSIKTPPRTLPCRGGSRMICGELFYYYNSIINCDHSPPSQGGVRGVGLLSYFIYCCDEIAEGDEGSRCEDEEEHAVAFALEGETEDGSCAEELTNSTQEGECEGETDTDTDAVADAGQRVVLRCECLSTAEDDAVDHDEWDEQSEGGIDVGHVGLHHHLQDGHERCDNDDVAWDAHHVGYQVLDERDDEVREYEHEHRGKSHGHTVDGT